MSLLKIHRYPDPILRTPTTPVEKFDADLKRLVDDMTETMYSKNGAGLAAIQIGVPLKLYIVEAGAAGGDPNDPPVVFCNPVIEWLSDETENKDEGCLSFPGIYVPVKRSWKARVRAQDVTGKEFVVEGEGLYARAMQHEGDHLDNRLLVDFVGPVKRSMIKRKMERMSDDEAHELQAQGE
jgi:peptide deformylase